jgi:putative transposase
MTTAAITELAELVGTRAACRALGRPQATHYRNHRLSPPPPKAPKPQAKPQPRALATTERQEILDVLHSPRFCDVAPAEVWATLIDEGVYLCSISTMYRVLREAGEVTERRRQATHPPRVKPELCATAPLQTWSWDITKLHGPAKWTSYYLYVIMDIFSRYVVGWMLAPVESSELAKAFIAQTLSLSTPCGPI